MTWRATSVSLWFEGWVWGQGWRLHCPPLQHARQRAVGGVDSGDAESIGGVEAAATKGLLCVFDLAGMMSGRRRRHRAGSCAPPFASDALPLMRVPPQEAAGAHSGRSAFGRELDSVVHFFAQPEPFLH